MKVTDKPDFHVTATEVLFVLASTKENPMAHLLMQIGILESHGEVFQVDLGELNINSLNGLIQSLTSIRDSSFQGVTEHDNGINPRFIN